MHELTVWAPNVRKITVKIESLEAPISMTGPDKRGWWRASVDNAGPGTDYGFLLDDDTMPYPDPRSAHQPHGVHGFSRVVDHSAFQWSDSGWQAPPLSAAIIYEAHVGTFTSEGTFDAAIERLDHLAELGITHLELLPVAEFPGDFGWGYDGVALFAVRHVYGGPEGLKRLIDACHQRGIAVLIDVVYNHFGPVGNYAGKFGPYMNDNHRTPWGEAVNFEGGGSDEVRRYFIDNALMWMRDYHVDGLRLDAVHEFVDRSAIHFMEQLSSEVEALSIALGRPLVLIAESDLNDSRVVKPREAGGHGIDAQWSDDFHHALFTVLHPGEGTGYYADFGCLEHLAKALTETFIYDGKYSAYRQRSHGRPVEGLSAHHFLGYIQNHDQIGNRATGDRLEHIVGLERAKVAAALVLTAPFIPMIFQGEEFAASTPFQYFAHHDDPEMARAVSEGRKREFAAFGWSPESVPDPESVETFQGSKLLWSETSEGEHPEMLTWFKKLIRLRRSTPSLNDGDPSNIRVSYDEAKKWLVMERGKVQVMCNLGDGTVELSHIKGAALVLASRSGVHLEAEKVRLPADSLAILAAPELQS